MDHITQAILRVQAAQQYLMDADMHVGKIHYIIKKIGFGEVLQVRGQRPQLHTEQSQSSSSILFLLLPH